MIRVVEFEVKWYSQGLSAKVAVPAMATTMAGDNKMMKYINGLLGAFDETTMAYNLVKRNKIDDIYTIKIKNKK